ncbi:MAG: UDP-N-acetylmuramoyl-tripeptide--D-alanyl-D-alanine ligase [Chitinophagaceae bacterium]|nr:UDP-N-acetylmuramoyl-tripeptide--D-alanyl-D-alanine ligase [Chitinophagaceae bacterium]
MLIEQLYTIYRQHPSVQTDTRKLKKDDIFFALKGPSFNGNQFARQALEEGASCVVVDEDTGFSDDRIFRVTDVLATLQQLAGYHRSKFNIPFIAITGSNGKTTTKELIHAVLSSAYKTYTTQGNLNNHIGIPLTLLSVKPDAEMAVIEMGANHLKEIEGYCTYTAPTHGIITNCGKAHLEGFGSLEGVRKGKGELYDYLRTHDGTAFVMWDYAYLRDMSTGIPHIVKYGTANADTTGALLKSEPFLEVEVGGNVIHTRLVGEYNLPNVLVAATVGRYFKISDDNIKKAIETYIPSNSRSQLIEKGTNKIILDAYNANPTSMKAAIENFAKLRDPQKILVLGAMMELGTASMMEHENLVALIGQERWDDVILVGGDFGKVEHPFHFFSTSAEAKNWLQANKKAAATYLVKGSRSTKMETILDAL